MEIPRNRKKINIYEIIYKSLIIKNISYSFNMSKTKLIEELCELCDSISELALKNQTTLN